MASIALSDYEIAVVEQVGPRSFLAARSLLNTGAVTARRADRGGLRGTVDDPGGALPFVVELPGTDARGASCSCGEQLCAHAAATLLAAARGDVAGPAERTDLVVEPDPVGWERQLDPWLAGIEACTARPAPVAAGVGLQVEVKGGWPPGPAEPLKLLARPVVRSHTGTWVRTGVSWDRLAYAVLGPRDQAARTALLSFAQLADDNQSRHGYGYSYGYRPAGQGIDLAAVSSRAAWEALLGVRDGGAAFVRSGRGGGAVVLHDPVDVSFLVARRADGLVVEVRTAAGDGVLVPADRRGLGADGTAALLWWQPAESGDPVPELHLAPVPATEARRVVALTGRPAVRVAASQEERFFSRYLPALRRAAPVRAVGVALPESAPPRVRLTVEPDAANRLALSWSWADGSGAGSDPVAEAAVLDGLREAVPDVVGPGTADRPGRLPAASVASGMAAVRYVDEVLPALAGVPDVEVDVRGELPAFRAADGPAVVSFTPDGERGERDWFDLAVTVSVEGTEVPFGQVFAALATGETHVVLADGTYFDVTGDRFAELAALIEESRRLNDAPDGMLRVSRYQTDLWADLEALGVVTGQARDWLATVRAIAEAPTITDHPAPEGLRAQLRPYQAAGFGWLATLYDNRLGGVLADDMGLGKTVQTLALFCHARAQDPDVGPFLVVAPTSVVTAWVAQARDFAPDLVTVAIGETASRRGGSTVADLAAGAHVIVTSYALFRIEREQYDEVSWAGLVLDEAQAVKNHATRGYHGARTLAAPFKLAITGTPLENNLMELWSLLSIVAPGLLAAPQRFTEYFRTPIERDRDGERLALLRRRIAPLMLRRAKEHVARDLPAKQEQVVEVRLVPKHRRAYDRFLQRERRKVLGLVDDVNRNRFQILRSLTLLRQASLDAALVDDALAGVPASKLDVMMELVEDLAAEGHRALVFSQFTRFLRAARDRITAAGIETCYLDGRTRNRAAVIEEFRSGGAPVFLVSLKAGGTGLTLTEADYCILLDPWWNPATENQAVDRTHRIGQTRNVHVYRLVAKDTIEEKVMALKAAKAELFSSVLDGGEFTSGALTADDIRALVQ